jgi:hypothetical protein
MVAPLTPTQRIVCTAVRIEEPGFESRNRLAAKPSELVPWTDPYIAGLVRRLQSEVRFERATLATAQTTVAHAVADYATGPYADLEPPSPSLDADWEAWDRPNWGIEDEPRE